MKRSLFPLFTSMKETPRTGDSPRAQLRVEGLEDRSCPSTTVALADSGHTLVITGDDEANQVSIVQEDVTNTLKVIVGAKTKTFQSSEITKILVDLKGGTDNFWYGLGQGDELLYSKEALILLGDGTDEANLVFHHGQTDQVTLYNNLNIKLKGGPGDDLLEADFGYKAGGQLNLVACMGGGGDLARARMWGDLAYAAQVTFDLRGGGGSDGLASFNSFDNIAQAYQSIDISPDSTFQLLFNGGAGDDLIGAVYSGSIGGRLNVQEFGGTGNDQMLAWIAPLLPSNGVLNAKVFGEDGSDALELTIEDVPGIPTIPGDGLTLENPLLHGGDGYDSGKATGNVLVFGCEL